MPTPHKRKVLTSGSGVEVYIADGDESKEHVFLSVCSRDTHTFAHITAKLSHEQMTDLMTNWLKRLPPDLRKQITSTLAREARANA